MAHTKFTAEVLTPEGEVFNGEVEMVSTRTSVGSLGVLAKHQPMLAMLEPTELRLYRARRTSCASPRARATCRSTGDRVLVLVEEAIRPGDLDAATCASGCARRRRRPSAPRTAPRRSAWPQRDARRWEAFLQLAEGGQG